MGFILGVEFPPLDPYMMLIAPVLLCFVASIADGLHWRIRAFLGYLVMSWGVASALWLYPTHAGAAWCIAFAGGAGLMMAWRVRHELVRVEVIAAQNEQSADLVRAGDVSK